MRSSVSLLELCCRASISTTMSSLGGRGESAGKAGVGCGGLLHAGGGEREACTRGAAAAGCGGKDLYRKGSRRRRDVRGHDLPEMP